MNNKKLNQKKSLKNNIKIILFAYNPLLRSIVVLKVSYKPNIHTMIYAK